MPDFAALQTRVNAAAMRHLANASATHAGREFAVQFDAPTAYPFTGDVLATDAPTCVAADADVADIVPGDEITINATTYTVGPVDPDGTGLTRLTLQRWE